MAIVDIVAVAAVVRNRTGIIDCVADIGVDIGGLCASAEQRSRQWRRWSN